MGCHHELQVNNFSQAGTCGISSRLSLGIEFGNISRALGQSTRCTIESEMSQINCDKQTTNDMRKYTRSGITFSLITTPFMLQHGN